jgi:hypothetical protein
VDVVSLYPYIPVFLYDVDVEVERVWMLHTYMRVGDLGVVSV